MFNWFKSKKDVVETEIDVSQCEEFVESSNDVLCGITFNVSPEGKVTCDLGNGNGQLNYITLAQAVLMVGSKDGIELARQSAINQGLFDLVVMIESLGFSNLDENAPIVKPSEVFNK